MKPDHIWPLVGVLLGWILSTLASEWNTRRADKKALGRLLSKLVLLHSHLRILLSYSEAFKDITKSWQEFERMRRHVLDRHFLEPLVEIERLNASIEEMSGTYPVEALKLRGLVDSLAKLKGASLSESAKAPDVYVRLLSVYEVGLELTYRDLRRTIFRLAFRHSVFTWLQIWWFFRKGRAALEKNEPFMKDLTAEVSSLANTQAQQSVAADRREDAAPAER